jgi:6,7-dimethyl-8-ribityllumazine synthase
MKHRKPRIAIIGGQFHKELIEEMITAATEEAQQHGAEISKTILVAGSYEVPLIADKVLEDTKIDALVVLGYIEQGETLHGEVMGHVVHRVLLDLQLEYGKPIGIGIIGPGATKKQAQARKVSAARGAVSAALQSLEILKKL